jgi:hypothetical protein
MQVESNLLLVFALPGIGHSIIFYSLRDGSLVTLACFQGLYFSKSSNVGLTQVFSAPISF